MEFLNPAQVHPALTAVVRKLGEMGVKRIILYGSRARQDNSSRADIDLAIDWPDITSEQRHKVADVLDNARTLLEIDFVFLDEAQGQFLTNILKDGKVLYDSGQSQI